MPYPDSYTTSVSSAWKPQTGGELDKRQARAWLYRVEDVFTALLPFILGAVLALGLMWAVRVASGGSVDLLEYLPFAPRIGGSMGKMEEVVAVPRTVQEQVADAAGHVLEKVQKAVIEGDTVSRGVVLSVPAVLMGAGWVRAQRLRGRGGARRGRVQG